MEYAVCAKFCSGNTSVDIWGKSTVCEEIKEKYYQIEMLSFDSGSNSHILLEMAPFFAEGTKNKPTLFFVRRRLIVSF
jgi:hypothetical protein